MKNKIISSIESLKSDRRIETFDEAATKQAIILKILSLLGWDTFNVDEVKPEYSVVSKRVDYSLRINNTNKVFIEVKKISEDLENHQAQLLNYSFQEGVKLAVLTNGITWWFYLPLNEGSWEQRKIYSIDLLQQESENVADKFIDFLSKENVSSGQSIKNMENEISKYYKDCHNCSYFRYFSYKYNVNEPFCTKYLQKISEIKICEKITRHRSHIKTDRQIGQYKRSKFNERLEDGFKLLSEDQDYED